MSKNYFLNQTQSNRYWTKRASMIGLPALAHQKQGRRHGVD